MDERENNNSEHFVVFKDSIQVEKHDEIESRSCCRCVDSLSFEADSSSFVSSAKRYIVQNEVEFGISLMYIINSKGPRILSWVIPDWTGSKSDEQPLTDIRWEQCSRYASNHMDQYCHDTRAYREAQSEE